MTGRLREIVADAGEGQQEEEPKDSSPAFFGVLEVVRSVGGRIFFEGSGHPVPIGTVCPQRVFIGRPPQQIIDVGVL